ncbi:MAG: ankyrin repeat domain-containing protein [Synergistaceae bacterium]|nr:ankyrin repeat domain-containing protein [Synergistaceae bacterium]
MRNFIISFLAAVILCSASAANDENFFQMVYSDDTAKVQKTIAAGQNVNIKNKAGETPLFAAIRRGSLEMVETLLTAGADVNARTKNGKTPLNGCVLIMLRNPEERLRIVRKLLDAGADPNIPTQDGTTPLMKASNAAAQASDESVFSLMKVLLDAGADVTPKDSGGMTALHWWAGSGKPQVVRLLLEAGADPNDMGGDMTSLMWAVVMHPYSGAVLEALIEGGADVNVKMKEGWTALSLAAMLGKIKDVSLLLKAGADAKADVDTLTPLHVAAGIFAMEREGLTGPFEERAQKAVNFFMLLPHIFPFSPDFLGVTKLLTEAGADADARCMTIPGDLMSLSGSDKEAIKRFEGKTPLEFARILGNEAVVKYLESLEAQIGKIR